jgi:SAM-dependent methyltransferase
VSAFTYVGNELELFAYAVNWKSYLYAQISLYLGNEVLEVGAGTGTTTAFFCKGPHRRWVCLEPDAAMSEDIATKIRSGLLPACCEVQVGTLEFISDDTLFDSIIYIDVVEHIEGDRDELAHAAAHLRPGGHLIVLSPAHNWLYTPFDKALGHFRRYSKGSLAAVGPTQLKVERLRYLDSVGLTASLGNKLLLNKSMPSKRQIYLWDSFLVRLSRIFDPLTGFYIGKSVLGVWYNDPEKLGQPTVAA